MNGKMLSVCLAALIVLAGADVYAKCVIRSLKVVGKIECRNTAHGVGGAGIALSLDGRGAAAFTGYDAGIPAAYATNPDGGFEGMGLYSTYKVYSPLTGHICTNKPRKLEVVITVEGVTPQRKMFDFRDLKVTADGAGQRVVLPSIEIDCASVAEGQAEGSEGGVAGEDGRHRPRYLNHEEPE